MSSPTFSSIDTVANTMPAKLRSLVSGPRPEIDIKLDTKRRIFSTLDTLSGIVTINTPVDTSFDDIEIEFIGTSRTYVERLTTSAAVSGRSEAFHKFLKLTQPGLAEQWPQDRVLRAGQVYTFPFVFGVPAQLLPRVCKHQVVHAGVRDEHLTLPPTFGDKESAAKYGALDDMAPDMASIRYGVFARIVKNKQENGETFKTGVACKAKNVIVIPATDEQPPLNVDGPEHDYVLRKEKKIKKGLFKGKLGSLVMETQQPKSLLLLPPNDTSGFRVSTMATVMLRFDPQEADCPPPRLNTLTNKLKATTFFASTARRDFPSKSACMLDMSNGVHTETIELSSRCVGSVEWKKMDARTPIDRRDSTASISSLTGRGTTPEPSEAYKGGAFYVARVLVPIDLPENKVFVPTFHSCLTSRTYSLHLNLSVHTAGLGGSLELKVPVQISSSASNPGIPEREGARGSNSSTGEVELDEESADVSGFFQPRAMNGLTDSFDAPPGYSAYPVAQVHRMATLPVY